MNTTHLNITIIFILSKCLSMTSLLVAQTATKFPKPFTSSRKQPSTSIMPWHKQIMNQTDIPSTTCPNPPPQHTHYCTLFLLLAAFGFVFPPNWEAQGWQLTEKAQTKHSHRTSHTSSGHHKWTFRVVWNEAFLWHEKKNCVKNTDIG